MEHRRADGREFTRWMPSVAFSDAELESGHFQQLRRRHLDTLSWDEAALVGLVQFSGEDS